MSTSRMARADFLSAIVFFVLGIYMVFEGLRMPGAGGFIETGGEPGRVPVLVGGVIALFALVLLVRSVRQGGHRRARDGDGMSDADRAQARVGTLRSLLAAVGCSVYAVGLLGAHIGGFSVSYPLATGLFILLFIMGFEWADAPEAGARRWAQLAARAPGLADALARTLARAAPAGWGPYLWLAFTALAQAVIVTAAVTYMFEQQFYVTLP